MDKINYKKGVLNFNLNKPYYSDSVVNKCLYWYLDKYNVDIISFLENFNIKISLKNGDEFDEEELIFRIKNDLIDFKLREIVINETSNLRELINAKAFANYDFSIIEKNSFEISDPVGFDLKEI
ncbi:His-Xaa-Ser system protein HxsD [Empedobacter falsenii]